MSDDVQMIVTIMQMDRCNNMITAEHWAITQEQVEMLRRMLGTPHATALAPLDKINAATVQAGVIQYMADDVGTR